MSTYNTPNEYIEEAINSILEQTYNNIELIIICDGCNDEYEYLKKYTDNRIKLYLNDENNGLAYSLNRAISESSGDYIARMDSDDISINTRIYEQVDFMEHNPEVDICATYAKSFGDASNVWCNYFTKSDEISLEFLYKSIFVHPTVMFRKSFIDKYDIRYNDDYSTAQDFELWSRLINKCTFAIIPRILLRYRVHNKQVSATKREQQRKFNVKILKRNSTYFKSLDNDKVYECLYLLSGRDSLNSSDIAKLSELIDYILKNNKEFDNKTLEKVLYNRFFNMIIKNRISIFNYFRSNYFKKIMHLYNFNNVLFRIKMAFR